MTEKITKAVVGRQPSPKGDTPVTRNQAFCADHCDQLGGYHTDECRRRRQDDSNTNRPVRGYVKAVLAHRKLKAKLEAKDAALVPLRRRVLDAEFQVRRRRGRLRGGDMAAAERLLKHSDATLTLLATPCQNGAAHTESK